MNDVNSPSVGEKNTILIKAFGWILLIVGLIIIGWTLIFSYNIFTGKTPAPDFFKIEAEETRITTQEKTPTVLEEMQKEAEKLIEEKLREVLPVNLLPGMLNLAVWSMLAFILIFGGSQLSGLGIKLIKK